MRADAVVSARWAGQSDVDWLATGGVELGELVAGGGEADGESVDFAEPAFGVGFGDPVGKVVADLDQPGSLGRVRA